MKVSVGVKVIDGEAVDVGLGLGGFGRIPLPPLPPLPLPPLLPLSPLSFFSDFKRKFLDSPMLRVATPASSRAGCRLNEVRRNSSGTLPAKCFIFERYSFGISARSKYSFVASVVSVTSSLQAKPVNSVSVSCGWFWSVL